MQPFARGYYEASYFYDSGVHISDHNAHAIFLSEMYSPNYHIFQIEPMTHSGKLSTKSDHEILFEFTK